MLNLSRLVSRMLQAVAIFAAVVGATNAVAQSLPAPALIPYTVTALAGNPATSTSGYSGDGGKAVGTTLNGPLAMALDAEGNIYIADTKNAVIREVNAATGTIKIIGGLPPHGCTLTTCTATTGSGDGVLATSVGLSTGLEGIAVDGFGNVVFSDYNNNVIRVIYKGGTQMANLITLEDPTAAPSASAVTPGYVYTIAGQYGVKSPTTDKVLATKGVMHDPAMLQMDAAGNIYFLDFGNAVVRVINAQSTAQTFFGVTLQPGYIGAIVNCGSYTAPCGTSFSGVAANVVDYGADLVAQGFGLDLWGNVYEVNTKSAPAIYGGAAYNGTGPLGHLLTLTTGNTPVAGDFYYVVNGNPSSTSVPAIPLTVPYPTAALANQYNNIVLRGTAITIDPKGNVYYMDNHFPWIFRVDVNSQLATRITVTTAATGGTATNPVSCSATPVFPAIAGFQGTTTDAWGDGCPTVEAVTSGTGSMTTDAAGNLYAADAGESLIRKYSVNTQFPSTPVGTPLTQMIQLHFDASNLPATKTPTTTSPVTIQAGSLDFSITTAPTCASNSTSTPSNLPLDASIDCVVPVTFNPAQPGLRQAYLQATTANGTVYTYPLSGIGSGAELVLDGGGQTVVSVTGMGAANGIAIDGVGNRYIADPTNNRVVELPVSGTQTTVGTGLSAPQAVAVDAAGNVYIADTGNNRAVMVSSAPGNAQTVIATGLNGPMGLAVDRNQNVYIADTGNARIVEVPASPALQTAVLFQFTSTPATILPQPVAIAVDTAGNVYVSDPKAKQIYEIPPGGGDLQNVITMASQLTAKDTNITNPNGLAVDGAGDLYVSDDTNNVVVEIPSSSGPGSAPFTLSFTGLSAPGGLALDPSGNLYVADTGNKRVLEMPRLQASVNFGQLGVFQPALNAPLTLSNIGTVAVSLGSPVYTVTGNTADFGLTDGCSGVLLYNGLTCSFNTDFLPVAAGSYTETISFAGGTVTASLAGTGVAPLAAIVTAFQTAPVAGVSTASVVATVTQPHGVNTPSGTVTFVVTVNEGNTARGGSTTTTTIPLTAGTGGAATAVLPLTGLLPARRYSIVATYNGDAGDTANSAAAFTFTVPGGTTLSVVSSSVSFVYGSAVPTLTGTVTGILPADAANITYTFVTAATPTTNVGTYPITVLLSGGNYLNYVVPNAVTSTGAPAVVTETPAPLSVKASSYTVIYGAQNITVSGVVTGAVNSDLFSVTDSPSTTSTLDVGTYTLVPTVTGPVANYTVTLTNGKLVVTPAATTVSITANVTNVLPTNLASAQVAITVGSGVSTKAIPGGTITLIDTFTPLYSTVANAPVNLGPFTLTNAGTTYTPTSTAIGTHAYTATYSGNLDFQSSSDTTAVNLLVDGPDFILTAPTTPIVVIPGTIPGGNAAVTGESAANPEIATVTLTPVLNYTGVITLTCSSPSSYVQCAFSPTTVTIATATAQTSTIGVQTPATLPSNYSGALTISRKPDYSYAWVPLGLLALLPLAGSRRRKLTRILWMLLASVVFSVGLSGCTITNLVKFYTPVPEGEQPLTITATDGTITKTFTMTISIQ